MNDSKVLDLAILIASQFYAKRAEFLIGFGWREVIDVGVFVLGMVVMFICLCRMSRMSNKHRWGPRLSYVSLFTASFTLSFAPWLSEPSSCGWERRCSHLLSSVTLP